jgi:hypothetical protein
VVEADSLPHVGRLRVAPGPADREHAIGGVEAADSDPRPSSGNEDPPGATPELENWAPVFVCRLHVETNVRSRRVAYDAIVELGNEWRPIVPVAFIWGGGLYQR